MHFLRASDFKKSSYPGFPGEDSFALDARPFSYECLVGTLERLIQDVNMKYSSVADGTLSVLLVSKEII